MADSQNTFPDNLCQCGCGQIVPPYKSSNRKTGIIEGQPHKFINGHNSRGSSHPGWKGGRYATKNGYILVHQPYHPNATADGYVLEHTLVIEKAMGKIFPRKAQAHHIDKNPSNNANNNLVACEDDAYHKLLHLRERALKECGHANWRKCNYCKQWDAPENLVIRSYPQRGVHHLMCSRKYAINLYWHSKLNFP